MYAGRTLSLTSRWYFESTYLAVFGGCVFHIPQSSTALGSLYSHIQLSRCLHNHIRCIRLDLQPLNMAAKLKGKANDPFPGFDFGPMGVDLEDDERTRLATDPGHAQSYYTAFDKIR